MSGIIKIPVKVILEPQEVNVIMWKSHYDDYVKEGTIDEHIKNRAQGIIHNISSNYRLEAKYEFDKKKAEKKNTKTLP